MAAPARAVAMLVVLAHGCAGQGEVQNHTRYCQKIASWADYKASMELRCVWDFYKQESVPAVCAEFGAEECREHEACVEVDMPGSGLACIPSLPNLACRLHNEAECKAEDNKHYCVWQDAGGWLSADHHTGCVAVTNAVCHRHATQEACTAAHCHWDPAGGAEVDLGSDSVLPSWLGGGAGVKGNTACASPYRCELIAGEGACKAAGCAWELYPMSPFSYCTPRHVKTCNGEPLLDSRDHAAVKRFKCIENRIEL